MRSRSHWKADLASILHEHNHRHAHRDKVVAHLTMQHRTQRLFSCFKQLRQLGYKIEDPRNLAPRHIDALLHHWVERRLAPATIQTWLSHLRLFGRWIGKPGLADNAWLVRAHPSLTQRHYAATRDASWSSHGVRPDAVIEHVATIDPYVANQLRAELLFGLRVKEAILLKPWRDDAGSALLVADGTKGGRPRAVPIDCEAQRAALNDFKRAVRHKGGSLADPSLQLHQALHRYYAVMRRAGINKKTLGVTSHGLRKEYANVRYRELAGVASPVQGGAPVARDIDREARLRVMEMLGHGREHVGTAYLGAVARGRRPATNDPAPPPGEPHT